jgi:hypothetical protein
MEVTHMIIMSSNFEEPEPTDDVMIICDVIVVRDRTSAWRKDKA